MPSHRSSRPAHASHAHLVVALGLVLFFIIYGSLYPFVWNFDHPQAFIWSGPVGLMDAIENIVLFLPLGGLLGWRYQGEDDQWIDFALWFFMALLVAWALQWLQMYLPRTPAFSDVVFNMGGHILGWYMGSVSRRRMHSLRKDYQHLAQMDPFAVLLVMFWILSELSPLVPTLDLSLVWDNVKSLWEQPFWQPRRFGLHVGMTLLGLSAFARMARSVGLDNWTWPLSFPIIVVLLAGKFIVVGQTPGPSSLMGIGVGWVAWLILDCAEESSRWHSVMTIAILTYLGDAIWPWDWRAEPIDMQWLPFASSLDNSLEGVISARAFECLCYGAFLWAASRNGAYISGLSILLFMLVLLCEGLQAYLPTRTPEITSPLMVLITAWLLVALTPKEARVRTRAHRLQRRTLFVREAKE